VIRVALTQRTALDPFGEVRDCLDQRWSMLLEAWNMVALPLPTALRRPEHHLDALRPDLVLLTGGNDLAALAGATAPTPARDAFEERVLTWCEVRCVGVVGICRGMQFLAHLGGSRLVELNGHVAQRHQVLVRGSVDTAGRLHEVNSYHRFGIREADLAPNFEPFAWDQEGNVEAFEDLRRGQVGVMWHPEREPSETAWAACMLRDVMLGLGSK
jgi:N5-(cytidine 5'-diphosphoramidyl)-L-glutamine hydrolase